jgi:hypothetical protein
LRALRDVRFRGLHSLAGHKIALSIGLAALAVRPEKIVVPERGRHSARSPDVLQLTRDWEGVCAMPERLERARRYRHHAEELRTMAKHWRDAETLEKGERAYARLRPHGRGLEHSAAIDAARAAGPER